MSRLTAFASLSALVIGPACAEVAGVDHEYKVPEGCVESCAEALVKGEYPCNHDAATRFDAITKCAGDTCAASCADTPWITDACRACLDASCSDEVQSCESH